MITTCKEGAERLVRLRVPVASPYDHLEVLELPPHTNPNVFPSLSPPPPPVNDGRRTVSLSQPDRIVQRARREQERDGCSQAAKRVVRCLALLNFGVPLPVHPLKEEKPLLYVLSITQARSDVASSSPPVRVPPHHIKPTRNVMGVQTIQRNRRISPTPFTLHSPALSLFCF